MNYKHIKFETHDSVALIKLNRPEKLNAFTLTMMEELCDAFDVIDNDDKIRATLITGSGRAFCAVLLLIASTSARFGFVFLNRGIVNDASSSWFLPKIVGISKALELCFSGKIIDANEAKEIGLVSYIFEDDEMLEKSLDYCKDLAKKSAPVSVAMARRLFWTSLGDNGPHRSHDLESIFISSRGKSGDAREGVTSFLEKRPADFPNSVSEDLPKDFLEKIEKK